MHLQVCAPQTLCKSTSLHQGTYQFLSLPPFQAPALRPVCTCQMYFQQHTRAFPWGIVTATLWSQLPVQELPRTPWARLLWTSCWKFVPAHPLTGLSQSQRQACWIFSQTVTSCPRSWPPSNQVEPIRSPRSSRQNRTKGQTPADSNHQRKRCWSGETNDKE